MLTENKILICKYCKKALESKGLALSFKTLTANEIGYYFVCSNNPNKYHKPMDNLDYIEHLAKQKNLI